MVDIYNIVHPTDVTTKRKGREGGLRYQGHTDTLPQLTIHIQYTSPFENYWSLDASLSGIPSCVLIRECPGCHALNWFDYLCLIVVFQRQEEALNPVRLRRRTTQICHSSVGM